MNKYSKAVKTAATVGMSLAMVLSAVPATTAMAATGTTCVALGDMAKFESVLAKNDVTYETMNSDVMYGTETVFDYVLKHANGPVNVVEADWTNATGYTIKKVSGVGFYVGEEKIAGSATDLRPYFEEKTTKEGTKISTKGNNDTIVTIDEIIVFFQNLVDGEGTFYVSNLKTTENFDNVGFFYAVANGMEFDGCDYTKEDVKNAKYAIEVSNAMRAAFGSDYTGEEDGYVYNLVKKLEKDTEIADSKLEEYQANLEDLTDDYSTNFTEAQAEMVSGLLDEIYGRLGIRPGDDKYEDGLAGFVNYLTDRLEDFVETQSTTGDKTITKSEIKAEIKTIKAEKKYNIYKNDAAVEAVLDEYEAMLDEIDAVADALNTKLNDVYADYINGGSKSIRNRVVKLLNAPEKEEDAVAHLTANISISDYEALKAFKEEVVDVVWTMESKEVANRFVDKSGKNVFATTTQLNSVLRDFMGTTEDRFLEFDTTEGTWAWDAVVEHMEEVISSLAVLENDLADLDAVTLTADDRDAIVAADDAAYFLREEGMDNLTSGQQRTVKNAERKVNELFEAYRKEFGAITTELNGWFNKGNGEWVYYENGNTPTKWVASGSNWYYVQDGVMLRNAWVAKDAKGDVWYYVGDNGAMVTNTTIDGCYINSFGAWTK